jgi:hypothetical protein
VDRVDLRLDPPTSLGSGILTTRRPSPVKDQDIPTDEFGRSATVRTATTQ